MHAELLSHVRLFVTPWVVVCQAPLSLGILQARILEWVAIPFSRGSSQPRDRIPGSPALQADTLLPGPPGMCSVNVVKSMISFHLIFSIYFIQIES